MRVASVAKDASPAIAAQALNVSLGLKFSRDLEAESDHLGAIWLTRAGYDPSGITRFFERILEEQERYPDDIPPYLFSHPDVDDRIKTVRAQAETLHPTRSQHPDLAASLVAAQERLRVLIETGRVSLPILPPELRSSTSRIDEATRAESDAGTAPAQPDPESIQLLLDAVDELSRAGELDAALLKLARAEGSADPRVSFTAGELLFAAGRYTEAAAAYHRTVLLDSTHARIFYKLGLAQARAGQRHNAVWAFEQAVLRTNPGTDLRRRVNLEIEKLTFKIVLAAGFPDGSKAGR